MNRADLTMVTAILAWIIGHNITPLAACRAGESAGKLGALPTAPPPRGAIDGPRTRDNGGVVTRVTKTTFTVREYDTNRVREFVAGLWMGGPRHPYGHTYRLIDLEVGDHILFDFHRINGVDTAESLCIRRRPGGRIPLTPGWRADDPKAPHAWAYAWQDFEEKGIPLPPHMDPKNGPGLINGRPPPPGTVLIPARLVNPLLPGPMPPPPGN